jgi:hypothetical protein
MGRAIAVILLLIAIGAAVVFWIYRGPSAPIDQVAAAKQKVQESVARSEAHRYAPEAVASIQRNLNDIDNAISTEQKKLPFRRNYAAILDKLDSLDAALQNLESMARANKLAMSQQVASALEQLQATTQTIEAELGNMPTAKGSRPALGAMRTDLATVHEAIEEIRQLNSGEQFQQANQKAAQVQVQADALLTEIRQTKERVRALRERSGP